MLAAACSHCITNALSPQQIGPLKEPRALQVQEARLFVGAGRNMSTTEQTVCRTACLPSMGAPWELEALSDDKISRKVLQDHVRG